jgi:intracellular septation protein A
LVLRRHRTIGIIEGAIGAKIAIVTWEATILAIPSTSLCVVNIAIASTITNPLWIRHRTIGIIEGAIGAKIAIIVAWEATIRAIPSTCLCVVNITITDAISNVFWIGYRTIGIIEVAVRAKIAIIVAGGRAIRAIKSTRLRVVNIAIASTITNPLWIRHRTVGIIEVAVRAKIAIIVAGGRAILAIPSTRLSVVNIAIASTITNPLWIRHRTIGIKEFAVNAEIAIFALEAITAIKSALPRVVKIITGAITDNRLRIWKRRRTIGKIEVALDPDIAILAREAITAIPFALRCVVLDITNTITNIF